MNSDPELTGMARGGAVNLVGASTSAVIGLVLVAAVARSYPPEVVGVFFAATSLFFVLGAVCALGTDIGLVRWLSANRAKGRYADARRGLVIAIVPVIGLGLLASAALLVGAPWLAGLMTADSVDQTATMLRILAVFLPLALVNDALLSATRGLGAMRPTVLVDKVGRSTVQLVGVLAARAVTSDPAALALAWAAPYLLGVAAGAWWYVSLSRRSRSPTEVLTTPESAQPVLEYRELAGEFWRFTAPRALAQVCQVALQRADILMVAALASPRAAAIYAVATRFMIVGQLGTQAVQLALQPAAGRLLAVRNQAAAARVLQASTTWTVILTWPLYVTMVVGSPLYLSLFGSEYVDSGEPAVVIIALAMLFATAIGPVDTILLMAGRSGLSLANNAAALACNLALNVALIPWLNITGPAISRAAALFVRNVLPLIQVRRYLRMTPQGSGLWWAMWSAVLCFGVLPLLVRLAFGPEPLPLAVALLVGSAGYCWLSWVGRRRLDLDAFAGLVRVRTRARRFAVPG